MGNLFEVNGWDIDAEIKDLFPNTLNSTIQLNEERIQDNDMRIIDFDSPTVKELLSQEGKLNEVLALCSQLIELKPHNEIAWLNKGNCLMKLRQYLEAIKNLEIAIQKEGTLIEAYYSLIECQYRLQKPNDAIKTFDRLIIRIPDNESIRLKKGLFMDQINHKLLAIVEYDKAIEINPLYAIAYYCKGNCLIELNKREEGLSCLDKAIELDNTNLNYLLRKAILLQEAEDNTQAKEMKIQMEEVINSSSFDGSKYDMNKITEAMKMIDVMSQLLSSLKKDSALELKRKIYQGSISSFYEGLYENKTVGVKLFPYKPELFQKIQKHCELFDSHSNRNVIEIYQCEKDLKDNTIRVIGEYCERGNLMKYFQKYTNIPLHLKLDMIREIANGAKYLIQHNICDFQLDLRKVVLNKNMKVKLCDIGLKAFFLERERERGRGDNRNLIRELRVVICDILKQPSVSSNDINLISLEKCLIDSVPGNIIHLLIEMFHEDMEENGIRYYLDYLTNKSNY